MSVGWVYDVVYESDKSSDNEHGQWYSTLAQTRGKKWSSQRPRRRIQSLKVCLSFILSFIAFIHIAYNRSILPVSRYLPRSRSRSRSASSTRCASLFALLGDPPCLLVYIGHSLTGVSVQVVDTWMVGNGVVVLE